MRNIIASAQKLVAKMRSVVPPSNLMDGCDGTEVWDTRLHSRILLRRVTMKEAQMSFCCRPFTIGSLFASHKSTIDGNNQVTHLN